MLLSDFKDEQVCLLLIEHLAQIPAVPLLPALPLLLPSQPINYT